MADLPISTSTTAASYLFKTAALINAISVPAHILFGWQNVDPFLRTLTGTPVQKLAGLIASMGWDHVTLDLIAAAALNWRWSTSRPGGPTQTDEKVIFVVLLAGGLVMGRRFWALGLYRPLICLWVAPLLSLAGWSLVW